MIEAAAGIRCDAGGGARSTTVHESATTWAQEQVTEGTWPIRYRRNAGERSAPRAGAFTASAGKARAQDPLTDREVLALVAEALTNREVAAALVLSERTVESHVRRILAKTGLSSRTELTRWYLQRR